MIQVSQRLRAVAVGMLSSLVMDPASAVNLLRDRAPKHSTIHPTGTIVDRRPPGGGISTYECSKYSDTCIIVVYAAPPAPASTSIDGNDHSKACYTAFEFDGAHAPRNTKKFVWVLVDAVEDDNFKYRFNDVDAVKLNDKTQYRDGKHQGNDRKIFQWHVKQPNAKTTYTIHVVQTDVVKKKDTDCDETDPFIANN